MRKGFVYQNPDAVGQGGAIGLSERTATVFMATAPHGMTSFLTRVAGDFEDEILYHFDGNGEILETDSPDAKRMTYEGPLPLMIPCC